MNIRELLEFEIYVMELCEKLKLNTARQLEELSCQLHQSIEIAIADYIDDAKIECDYESQF